MTQVAVDEEGLVSAAAVRAAVRAAETVLVTVMHSNNEVGSLMPVAEIAAATRAASADGLCLVHTDAAQSIGKVCNRERVAPAPGPLGLLCPVLAPGARAHDRWTSTSTRSASTC